MDAKLVYRKTLAGEDALRERTRLRRSRLRAVLILVDGQTPALKLCQHLGSAFRPKATLNQLERLRLIERVFAEAPPREESEVAADTARATMEIVGESTDFWIPIEGIDQPEGQRQARLAPPPRADGGLPEIPPAAVPAEVIPPAAPASTASATQTNIASFPAGAVPDAQASSSSSARTVSYVDRLRTWVDAMAPRRPRGRRPRAWRRLVLIGVTGAVVVLVAAALLFPYDRYRADLEAYAGHILGEPVAVDAVRITLAPRLGLELHSVRLGSPSLARATLVRLLPVARTLMFSDRILVDLEVQGIDAGAPAVAALCSRAARAPAEVGRFGVRRILVSELTLRIGGADVAGLHGEARLQPGPQEAALALANREGNLAVYVFGGDRGCRVAASARGWRLPFRTGLRVEALEAGGMLNERGLRIDQVEARLEDGLVSANGTLDWVSNAKLDLQLNLRRVGLTKLFPALGISAGAAGYATGTLRLSGAARDVAALEESLAGAGRVSVTRGALSRIDLVEAVRTDGTTIIRGGTTHFEELSARLEFLRGSTELRDLRLDAGALRAEGHVEVDGRDRLRGSLVASVRSPAGVRSVPIDLSGTLATPQLVPARGS